MQYKTTSEEVIKGTFLPEDLVDPIITGRAELGAPKVGCRIDISAGSNSRTVKLCWRGATFVELEWTGLTTASQSNGQNETPHVVPKPEPDKGILMYRYVPAVREPGKADAECAVFEPYPMPPPTDSVNNKERLESESKANGNRSESDLTTSSASIKCVPGDWDSLPTLHHIAKWWSEMPIYEILEATIRSSVCGRL